MDIYYDDIAFSDSAYPGAGQAGIAVPTGAGDSAQWTNGSGSTFAEVDEVPPDDDTTYLMETGTNGTHSLATGNHSGISGTISAVKLFGRVRNVAAGAGSIALRWADSGGGSVTETAWTTGSTSYVNLARLRELSPKTGTPAWSAANLATLEIGVVNANANDARCTALYAMVWCTGTTPQVVTPATASLTTATFAPTTRLDKIAAPGAASLATAAFAPTIINPESVTPATLAAALAAFAPSISVGQLITPGVAALALAAFAPTIINPQSATPGLLELVTATFAPTVPVGQLVTPATGSLLLAAFAPLIVTPVVVTPGIGELVLAAFAPTAPVGIFVTPDTLATVLTAFAPTAGLSANILVQPGPGALVIVTFAPDLVIPILLPGPQRGVGRYIAIPVSGLGRVPSVMRGAGRYDRPQRGGGR